MAQAVGFPPQSWRAGRRDGGSLEPSVAQVVEDARTVAVLEGVNDHENLGSIFRNAAGLGVDAVVFGSGCADPLYRRAVRVSMGHALLVPYARAADWPADLVRLKEQRISAVGDDPARRRAQPAGGDGRSARRTSRAAGGRRGPGADGGRAANQRHAGAHPDVAWHRLAQRRDGGRVAFYERARQELGNQVRLAS